MRIDYEERTVHCSVGDLVSRATPRPSGLDRGSGFRRMWLGQEIHTRRAEQRASEDPHYLPEQSIRYQTERGGWSVTITGRIDGISLDPARNVTVIEEVKSLHFARELHALRSSTKLQGHLFQLMLYAWFLSRDEPWSETLIHPQLVLIDLVGGDTEIITAPWDEEEIESALEGVLRELVEKLESDRLLIAAKASFASILEFPHPRLRPFQTEMIETVDRAMKQSELLLVSAPTGIGKTAAAIYPALKEALSTGKKLFFLTSKTLQQEMAAETLAAMNDGSFRVLRIRAKKKMCAHEEMICHEDFCPFARQFGHKLDQSNLLNHLMTTCSYLDPDEIFEASRSVEVCPFEVTLELIEQVDVVLCDYNYVFDPWIGLSALREKLALSETILVVDEAHNLLPRARQYFSPEISERSIDEVSNHLALRPGAGIDEWEELVRTLREHLRDLAAEAQLDAERPGPVEALCEPSVSLFHRQRRGWEQVLVRYIDWKIRHSIAEEEDPLIDFYFSLMKLSELLEEDPSKFARIIDTDDSGRARLRIFCLDPSRHLGTILGETHASVLMSATLEPFEFHQTTLGLPRDRTAVLSLPSPFPRENRRIMIVPSVETTWKKRAGSYDRISELVAGISEATDGNTLALFPSYSFLKEVHDRLPRVEADVEIQRTDMTDWERRSLLDTMRRGERTLVLAVSGGMYAEGIDYRGSMLSSVVVVGPALPAVTFEQNLLKQYFDEQYEAGFEYAYLIPGMTRVVQSAGRVIRSETDTGVIALLDRRFTWASYNRFLPEWWYEESLKELTVRDPVRDSRDFFESLNRVQASLF